jgi:hypothetical protein
MSSTAPEPDTQATPIGSNDDSAEKYGDMNGNADGFEAESPQAKQAKAEALAHARAARAARAKYTRLVSQQAGAGNPNPMNRVQAESLGDKVATLSNRIDGAELSFALARIVDQFHHSSFVEAKERDPGGKAVWSGLATFAPVMFLRPRKRGHGVGGRLSDPRILSLGVTALVALADAINANRLKSGESQANGKPPGQGPPDEPPPTTTSENLTDQTSEDRDPGKPKISRSSK